MGRLWRSFKGSGKERSYHMEHVHEHTFLEMVDLVFTAEELRPLMALWLAVLGAVLGSFLCCAAARRGSGESVLKGRSRCDSCGHVLAAWEMIPVFSWPLLRGKCRHCGAKIPPADWLGETLLAAAFGALTLVIGVGGELWMWLILAALLTELSLIDAREQILPDSLLIAAAAVRLVFWAVGGFSLPALKTMAIGAVSVSVPVLAAVLVMDKVLGRESMGGGDIKLLAVLGLYLDWRHMLLTVLAACLMGIVGGAIGRKKGKPFPFGPYIALAAVLVRLAGEPVIGWYMGLF